MKQETIKQYVEDKMLRGSYATADESPLESPLQFILWLANQQNKRNLAQQEFVKLYPESL